MGENSIKDIIYDLKQLTITKEEVLKRLMRLHEFILENKPSSDRRGVEKNINKITASLEKYWFKYILQYFHHWDLVDSSNDEIVNELLKCIDLIISYLTSLNVRQQRTYVLYIYDFYEALSEVICDNNIRSSTSSTGSMKSYESYESPIQGNISDNRLIIYCKFLNPFLSFLNKVKVYYFHSDCSDTALIFMLHKTGPLILHEQHKMLCVSLYMNVLEHFQSDKQYEHDLLVDNLKTLFQSNDLDVEVKFTLIIFVFDHISVYLESTPNGKSSEPTPKINASGLDLYNDLKSLALSHLTSENASLRKSALYVMKRLHLLDTSGSGSMFGLFFHIYETLDETQVNLVLPVIAELSSCEDLQLVQIIVTRMLQHESMTIIKAGIGKLHLVHKNLKIVQCILPTLMKALNNSALFMPESEVIRNNLIQLFQIINNPYAELNCYQDLIDNIIDISWGPVPLFYVTYYLQLSSQNQIINTVCYSKTFQTKLDLIFESLSKLVQLDFKHNKVVRSAIEKCLREHVVACVIQPLSQMNIIVDNANMMDQYINFLNVCKQKFVANSSALKDRQIEENSDYYDLYLSLAKSLSFEKHFVDSYIEYNFIKDKEINETSFNKIYLFLLSGAIDVSMFASKIESKIHDAINFFENTSKIIEFAEQCCRLSIASSRSRVELLEVLLPSSTPLLSLITKNRDTPVDERFMENIASLMKENKHFCSDVSNNLILHRNISFHKKQFGCFQNEYTYLYFSKLLLKYNGASKWLEKHTESFRLIFDKESFFDAKNRPLILIKLDILAVLAAKKSLFVELCDLLISNELCIECLSNTGRDCLVPIQRSMKHLIPPYLKLQENHASQIVHKFLEASWKEVLNSKRTTLFRTDMKTWIETTFQTQVLLVEEFHPLLLRCMEQILEHEESATFLYDQLLSVVHELSDTDTLKYKELHMTMLLKGLLYGEIPKKDIVIERNVSDFILENNLTSASFLKESNPYIDYYHSREVRRAATSIAMVQGTNESYAISLIMKLIEAFDFKGANAQYFNNSITHRSKQRAVQNILLIDHMLTDPIAKRAVFVWALESIFNYNHQPSIRYCLEWLIIRNMAITNWRIFWTHFDKAFDERPGSIVSFLSIIFHVVRNICETSESKACEDEIGFIDEALKRVIPCSMSQLFNLRLYAHVVFTKLFKGLVNFPDLKNKYELVFNALIRTMNSAKGNAIINCEKLNNDFYFNQFRPYHQFTLETIFHDIPRLANVNKDEWMPWTGTTASTACVPVVNTSEYSLANVARPEWILTSASKNTAGDSDHVSTIAHDSTQHVSQKKFIPVKCTPLVAAPHLTNISELIIVTSLIDKVPNIGGLSRTCEVFGATLVVDNLEVVKDVQFKALSMTSEKHVNIVEAKKYNLKEYLRRMKCDEGYVLIGAEQTNTSVNLAQFKYPKKSILVLGNEKNGVPSDILVLLDSYVEIPQLGVLRSLNVHVTGAVFIWEYVKQHCLQN